MNKQPPELVIFDCDGVLVDSIALACDLLATMLSEQGLPTTPREARVRYKELLLADVVSIAERDLGRALPDDWLECYESRRADAFGEKLTPVQGAAETVRRVSSAGVRVCVASQGKLSKTRLSLELTGLSDLFSPDALFSAYSVPRGKPYPDVFLHAAAAMGVQPHRCAVVEDSPSGIQGAIAAGMRAIGYPAPGEETVLRDAGAEILSTLAQLPSLLAMRTPSPPSTQSEAESRARPNRLRLPAGYATRQTPGVASAQVRSSQPTTEKGVPTVESSDAPIRILVVAHKTAATQPLLDAVRERARRGPCTFTLLVPKSAHGLHKIVDPEDQDAGEANAVIDQALPQLSEAAGTPVEGIVGAPDPVVAVHDAINLYGFDEVIISTLPTRLSRWLKLDLPSKVSGTGLPVTTVTSSEVLAT